MARPDPGSDTNRRLAVFPLNSLRLLESNGNDSPRRRVALISDNEPSACRPKGPAAILGLTPLVSAWSALRALQTPARRRRHAPWPRCALRSVPPRAIRRADAVAVRGMPRR